LSYCSNGDLLTYLNKAKQFPIHVAQFYAAEIVDALTYMHGKKIVHRLESAFNQPVFFQDEKFK